MSPTEKGSRASSLDVRRIWLVGLAGAVLAAIANSLIRLAAVAVLDPDPGFDPFGPVQPVLLTVAAVLAGTAVLAALTRFVAKPVRVFRILAVVAVVLSFIPNLMLLAADPPPFPGITGTTVATLMLMHVVAALIAVPMLTTLPRASRRRARDRPETPDEPTGQTGRARVFWPPAQGRRTQALGAGRVRVLQWSTERTAMSTRAVRLVSAAAGVLVAVIAYVVSSRVLGLTIDVAVGRLDFALNLAHFVAVTAAILVLALAAATVLERRAAHPQRAWLGFAFAGLLLSLVPTLLLVDGFAARGILMIAHLGVAAVVIPGIAATLPDEKSAERGGSAPHAPVKTAQQR